MAPVDHSLPLAALDVRVTLPSSQIEVEPLAVIVGVAGILFTVTVIELDTADSHPFSVTVTLNVPGTETVNV